MKKTILLLLGALLCFNTPLIFGMEISIPLDEHLKAWLRETRMRKSYKQKDGIIIPTDNKGVTPLHQAAGSGEVKTLKAWLRGGANPNIRTKKGETPLHYAARSGCPKTITLLLQQEGINFYEKMDYHDGSKKSALEIACLYKHIKAVRLLLQACNNYKFTPTRKEIIALLNLGTDKATSVSRWNNPLSWIFETGIPTTQDELAEHLYHATARGDKFKVRLLLSLTVDKDKSPSNFGSNTALTKAASSGRLSIVQELLKAGVDKNKTRYNNETPLFCAAQKGHLAIVKELVQAGANINQANCDNETPLFVAAKNDHLAIVEFLLQAGAYKGPASLYNDHRLVAAAQKRS